MVPGYQSSIPRPYRERVGWKGKQRETLRGEEPVRTGVLRVSPGQRVGSFRAHNPKVAGTVAVCSLARILTSVEPFPVSTSCRASSPAVASPLVSAVIPWRDSGSVFGFRMRFKSRPRYEENPWGSHISRGSSRAAGLAVSGVLPGVLPRSGRRPEWVVETTDVAPFIVGRR